MNWYRIAQHQINIGFRATGMNLGSTEGIGLYVSHDQHFAHWMGDDIAKVRYYEPSNPLIVDREPLYVLHKNKKVFEPIKPTDSEWTRLNKLAFQNIGSKDFDDQKVQKELTKLIKENGYDAIRVIYDDRSYYSKIFSWDIILDSSLIVDVSEPKDMNKTEIEEDNWFVESKFGKPIYYNDETESWVYETETPNNELV